MNLIYMCVWVYVTKQSRAFVWMLRYYGYIINWCKRVLVRVICLYFLLWTKWLLNDLYHGLTEQLQHLMILTEIQLSSKFSLMHNFNGNFNKFVKQFKKEYNTNSNIEDCFTNFVQFQKIFEMCRYACASATDTKTSQFNPSTKRRSCSPHPLSSQSCAREIKR